MKKNSETCPSPLWEKEFVEFEQHHLGRLKNRTETGLDGGFDQKGIIDGLSDLALVFLAYKTRLNRTDITDEDRSETARKSFRLLSSMEKAEQDNIFKYLQFKENQRKRG